MPHCLMCSHVVEGANALCAACERTLSSDLPGTDADTPSGVVSPVTEPLAAESPLPSAGWKRWPVAAALAAAGGTAAITFALLGAGGAVGPAAVDQASFVGNGSAPAAARAMQHTWTDANSARWVSNHPRSVAFELTAENTASAGMARVRPILVVRCLSNATEAFVFTEWPAAIEAQDDRRTTHISFDEEEASVERWLSSESRDALFAPDGVAFARRVARGQTLRFGFTPHNGKRETIEFHVGGFAEHVRSVARLCGWK